MAQRDHEKNLEPVIPAACPSLAITGADDQAQHLVWHLKNSMKEARQIDIIVSFLMESGVRMMLPDLKKAIALGTKIRLLTGNYLGITQPSALYLVKNELDNQVDLRFYNDSSRSFHPKAYIFHYENQGEIYVGSSNISKSALTSGIEWNYRFSSKSDPSSFANFYHTFNDLFDHHSIIIDDLQLKKYASSWIRPTVMYTLNHYDFRSSTEKPSEFEPRGAQIEALYSLKKVREQGATKGLIYAATGIGKTYLAAFDSVDYKRVLFVAHREEILFQAAESFKNVRKTDNIGFFNGKQKDTGNDLIFASVASLGKSEYLSPEYFAADYFDYIVIDEFHHAVNDSYLKIIEYFQPKFLLGLTATPERMDGRNIYELCDYIVPYQISLKDAINQGLLVPFRYYGIYDETVDYSKIPLIQGKYNLEQLNISLMVTKRYDLIYRHYLKYASARALGFCSSIEHAKTMAHEFTTRKIPAVAVYSGPSDGTGVERSKALEMLEKGEIKVIFSVDMFNEGLDIPAVDMVMFLRPTESPVVFLQQLGRGLRQHEGKEYLNVLDFIGNYQKAGIAPFLLSGETYNKKEALKREQRDFKFPVGCLVDFDLRLIDLFKQMAQNSLNKKELIVQEYQRIKEEVGHRPTRIELFTYMEDEIYELCQANAKLSPFKDYLGFLNECDELSEHEQEIYHSPGKGFIKMIETTSMTKSYKMPLLQAFYNDGKIKMAVDEDDVYIHFRDFYNNGLNGQDLEKDKGNRDYLSWGKNQYVAKAKAQPIRALLNTASDYFIEKDGYLLALNQNINPLVANSAFIVHFKDAVDYRTMEYYRRNRFVEPGNFDK